MMAERVTFETARKVAETFLQTQTGKKTTLSLIRYEDQANFHNFYVFGTEHSFVIVSADDCVQPILGYSTENQFGTEKMPDNLFLWLSGYEEQISDAEKTGRKASNQVKQQWNDLITGNISIQKDNVTEVGPLIKTKWDQGSPYNYYCPSGKSTGCVATAMAQIMKYWNYPTTGFGSHSYTPATHPEYGVQTAVFGETTYDWEHMINSYSGSTYSETEREAVAKLMYHCGVSVNMNYGESGSSSGAITFAVVPALQNYFNYSNKIDYISRGNINDDQKWKDTLRKELNEGRPIQYRGAKTGGGGHSFVCDGYNSLDKFHFNWGWSGSTNGFFTIDEITYSIGQEAIIGIKPINCEANPPVISLTKNQRNISLNWGVVDNASTYNVYRNYDLIGSTNSNSYLDSQVPAGNYVYFVRSVDSEGNVSLPSNTISVEVEFSYTLDDLVVQNLEVSYNGEDASLQWTAPINLHYLDFPSFEGTWGKLSIGTHSTFYWGARFPVSMLDSGFSVTSISTYFYTPGTYTAYIYQCTSSTPSGTPSSVSGTYSKGWHSIPINSIPINSGMDVWVIFKSTGITYPTIVGVQNVEEGNYYSYNGTTWGHSPYSFFISASLSDGNFTYNLYDNGEIVATGLNSPIHTLSNISSNTVHQYTVKTKLGEQESLVSNMAGVTLGTASLTNLNLGSTDMMIVAPNSCLTIVDDLVNDEPDKLILEDGAQLIHNSVNVQATVKKSIDAHDTDDGWNFIASPIASSITPSEIIGLLANDYDLYRFTENPNVNPSTGIGKEWENYRIHQDDFNIDNGQGYLYANSDDVTLTFAGTIYPSSQNISKTLEYHSDAQKAGWNLVGNPFTCTATISDGNGNPKPFYVISGNTIVANTSTTIMPCIGVMVKADGENEAITFTKASNQPQQTSQLQMTLSHNSVNRDGTPTVSETVDNAIVCFDQVTELEKFVFNTDLAKIYIPQNGNDYAVVSSVDKSEIPVNFSAAEDGSYTLSIKPEGIELGYLHLIDNLTGNDVDLLVTPSYTFEAKPRDYATRFKLVFDANAVDGPSTGSGTFAFISDGNIIVTDGPSTGSGTCATLQIVDMMGRVVVEGDATNRISISEIAPGVYVLRLIDGEKVKTQKIVIE